MTKTFTALAAAATIGIAAIAAPTTASAQWRHHHHHGGAVAAGVLGGLAAGALIGSAAGAPYYGYPYGAYAYGPAPVYGGACFVRRERFWDGFGWRIRRVQVCD